MENPKSLGMPKNQSFCEEKAWIIMFPSFSKKKKKKEIVLLKVDITGCGVVHGMHILWLNYDQRSTM